MNKFYTSDITNVILSAFGIKIKSLLLIQYYNSKEKLELSYKPKSHKKREELLSKLNLDDNLSRRNELLSESNDDTVFCLLNPDGFFVVTIDEEDYVNDYRVTYNDFIKGLRDNKLNELGI